MTSLGLYLACMHVICYNVLVVCHNVLVKYVVAYSLTEAEGVNVPSVRVAYLYNTTFSGWCLINWIYWQTQLCYFDHTQQKIWSISGHSRVSMIFLENFWHLWLFEALKCVALLAVWEQLVRAFVIVFSQLIDQLFCVLHRRRTWIGFRGCGRCHWLLTMQKVNRVNCAICMHNCCRQTNLWKLFRDNLTNSRNRSIDHQLLTSYESCM